MNSELATKLALLYQYNTTYHQLRKPCSNQVCGIACARLRQPLQLPSRVLLLRQLGPELYRLLVSEMLMCVSGA